MHACRPRIRAVRDRPVARHSQTPWQRALEHAGRALAGAMLHPGPRSGRWSPLAAKTDLGGDQSRVHGFRGPGLQAPRLAAGGCMVTQARVGEWGCFLDASGLTRPSKYDPARDAALRRLKARARCQTISAFEPLVS